MAVWRTRAYDLFGFKAGEYSSARGKIELLADLIVMAQRAGAENDGDLLDRIAEYVRWAARQKADDLQSAVDLAFFLPMFRDAKIQELFRDRFPGELVAEKNRLLMNESDV